MRKQICWQFKDVMEESNKNNVFIFKQNKRKNKKCNFKLDLNLQRDKRELIENFSQQ